MFNSFKLLLKKHLAKGQTLTPYFMMKRSNYMLAVLATANNDEYTPVQIQKLFFLLDRNITERNKIPSFNFEPYYYGPFDKEIYTELNNLQTQNLLSLNYSYNNLKKYKLTPEGQRIGEKIFNAFDKGLKDYIKRTNEYVRKLSFEQLIKAIYKEYPDTKVNSIFS